MPVTGLQDQNSFGSRLMQYRAQGYDLNAPPVSVRPVFESIGRGAGRYRAEPLPMPDTSQVMQSGKMVSITPENYARSFVPSTIQGGKEIPGGQALFIHPSSGEWVPFSQLPIGQDGLRQSIGQQDGNPAPCSLCHRVRH